MENETSPPPEPSIEDYMSFILAAHEATEDTVDSPVGFDCPKCGGMAFAAKSSYNGHVKASCQSCSIAFIE